MKEEEKGGRGVRRRSRRRRARRGRCVVGDLPFSKSRS